MSTLHNNANLKMLLNEPIHSYQLADLELFLMPQQLGNTERVESNTLSTSCNLIVKHI